jgi:hypothetical protein
MKLNTLMLVLLSIFFLVHNLLAQQPGTGMLIDNEAYAALPKTAPLTRGDFDNLPSSADLRKFAPTPGNQGQTGTCTAWSSAYHARTIAESVHLNRTNKAEINANTFSPSYVYNQIRLQPGCKNGTYIHTALDLMKKEGVAKYADVGFNCEKQIGYNEKQQASPFRILGYKTLFDHRSNNKILPTKKSLANNHPVVIGMNCAPSFFRVSGVWTPTNEERTKQFGGHAMVAVGYDDNKYGGSFLIMNSWGSNWGNDGFIWIKYQDFNDFVFQGYEMIGKMPEQKDFEGMLTLNLQDGGSMQSQFIPSQGIYRITKPYPSGTKFQIAITNNKPAYVYAFGSDLTKESFRIFPHLEGISPFLSYKNSTVVIPGEDYYVRMNDTKGMDYICVLYSSEAIEIDQVMQEVENAPGQNFKERLLNVLGNGAVGSSKINYSANQAAFTGSFSGNGIIPLIIELEHI